MSSRNSIKAAFDNLINNDRAQLLSILISQLKDIELAEDVLQDALIKAWSIWPTQGFPNNPKSWLLKTAYNQAIDKLRRQQNFNHKQPQISHLQELMHALKININDQVIPDERLKLIFTCCHPALDKHNQVALTLNTICGFTTEQVAHLYIVKTTTMAQRLVRTKRKIKYSGIPFQIPDKHELPSRLDSVLAVIYLIYNQGYYASDNPALIDREHSDEAIYLALTLNQLLPNQAELLGLLALMHFHSARQHARNQHPTLVTNLEDQNRKLWDQVMINQANDWFTQATALKSMGPYQIQAAISGVHIQAENFADTDWQQIVLLYTKLNQYQPIATVKINQAVAMTYNKQAKQALKLLQDMAEKKLDNYLPYYLAKAHALKSLGQKAEAINHYSLALGLSKNNQERAFLNSQIKSITESI